jgi:hypothetical protein
MGRGGHRRYRHLNIFIVCQIKDGRNKDKGSCLLSFVYPSFVCSNNDILLKEVSFRENNSFVLGE